MSAQCAAMLDWLGHQWQCPSPSIGRYRRGCIHEHIRDEEMCQEHVGMAENLACLTCYNLPGDQSHECPIILQSIPVGAS